MTSKQQGHSWLHPDLMVRGDPALESSVIKCFDHNTYPRAFVRIRPSKLIIGQVGAFAVSRFRIGEVIVRARDFEDDNLMTVAEYNKLDRGTKAMVKAHSTITAAF